MNILRIILQIQFTKFMYEFKIILAFTCGCDKNVHVIDINSIVE